MAVPPPPPAAAPWDGVVVRFGEIGIKSAPVRRQMLEALRRNLLSLMESGRVEGDVLRLGSRLWMVGPDVAALLRVATHTFGVVSASPARRVPADMAALCQAAVEVALHPGTGAWSSFAIRARREGQHPFSSQDVNVQAGSAVFTAAQAAGRSPRVDLGDPELAVDIDVRQGHAFLSVSQEEGPGGIPAGTQGTVLALVSDAASFLAAWLMMRRGCRVVPLHAGTTGSVPMEAMERMAQWGLQREVEVLPLCKGTIPKQELLAAAATVAADHHATALVTGEHLGSDLCAAPLPVLRPLCGLDPEEEARWMARCGLPPFEAARVLDAKGPETAASALAMRTQVTA